LTATEALAYGRHLEAERAAIKARLDYLDAAIASAEWRRHIWLHGDRAFCEMPPDYKLCPTDAPFRFPSIPTVCPECAMRMHRAAPSLLTG